MDQGRAQHVRPDMGLQSAPEGGHVLTRRPARPRRDERRHRLLVGGLLLRPARVQPGLPHVLPQGLLDPLRGRRAQCEHRLPGRPGQLSVRNTLPGARDLGQHVGPALRALREDGQRRPYVGTALGVVRRDDRPAHRPVALDARAVGVEVLREDRRASRLAAHLGRRQQRHIAVERRVLHGLGAQRRGGLREARPELHVRGPVAVASEHQVAHDVDRAGLLGDHEGEPRLGRGLLGDHPGRVPRGVRPVDLQADEEFLQGRAQRPGRPVAQRGFRRQGAQAARHPGQPVGLRRQLVREHLVRRPSHRRRPVTAPVRLRRREPPVLAEEFPGPRRVREETVDVPQRVVAGGARDGPGRRQVLPVREDLLHDRPAAAGRLVQPQEVGVGVG